MIGKNIFIIFLIIAMILPSFVSAVNIFKIDFNPPNYYLGRILNFEPWINYGLNTGIIGESYCYIPNCIQLNSFQSVGYLYPNSIYNSFSFVFNVTGQNPFDPLHYQRFAVGNLNPLTENFGFTFDNYGNIGNVFKFGFASVPFGNRSYVLKRNNLYRFAFYYDRVKGSARFVIYDLVNPSLNIESVWVDQLFFNVVNIGFSRGVHNTNSFLIIDNIKFFNFLPLPPPLPSDPLLPVLPSVDVIPLIPPVAGYGWLDRLANVFINIANTLFSVINNILNFFREIISVFFQFIRNIFLWFINSLVWVIHQGAEIIFNFVLGLFSVLENFILVTLDIDQFFIDRLNALKDMFPLSWIFQIYNIISTEIAAFRNNPHISVPNLVFSMPTGIVLAGMDVTLIDFERIRLEMPALVALFRNLLVVVISATFAFYFFNRVKGFILGLQK